MKKTIIMDWGDTLERGSEAARPLDIVEKGGCAARYTQDGRTKVIYGGNERVLRQIAQLRKSGANIDYFTCRIGKNQKQILKELKGQEVYVFTSGPMKHLQRLADKSGLSVLVKGIISSSDLEQDKKNPNAYKALAGNLKINTKDIIYFDDSKDNVSAARKAGCDSVLYNGKGFGNLSEYIGSEN